MRLDSVARPSTTGFQTSRKCEAMRSRHSPSEIDLTAAFRAAPQAIAITP